MPDFTVHNYGTDSSGRGIYMTAYMAQWIHDVGDELGWQPVIIQGAFMTRNGGGAADSEGYHDKAGCVDVRTRDLTTAQIDALVRVCRDNGAAAWRRDQTQRHGAMDSHCHITLGADYPLSDGARVSWSSYVTGGDGLFGPYDDYEYRPDPLVLVPPEGDDMPSPKDWDAEDYAALMEKLGKPLVKAIWDSSVTKASAAGVAARAALRKAAGL